MTCRHHWTPTPATATAARALVGLCHCLRCHRVSTAEDMEETARSMLASEPVPGEIVRDYDVLR